MSDHCLDYDGIKELAKELGRPPYTLVVLNPQNDPFWIMPSRERDAKWFKKIWQGFHCQPGRHVRRIHYMLVSQDPPVKMPPDDKDYLNTTACAQFLSEAARDARYLGLIGLRDVIDQRNAEADIHLSKDEETSAAIDTTGGLHDYVPPGFEAPRLDVVPPTIPQKYHIEIWCEKSTMGDILRPIAERYGINLVLGIGELSLTRCIQLVDRARASGKLVRILYISDFDAGGMSMPTAVARKIEWVVRKEGHDLDIQIRPVVLTYKQCLHYRLPRTPMKDTEKRAERFEERFGSGATELDALEALYPGELERILVAEIERYYDDTLDDQIDDVVKDVQAELDEINDEVKRQHAKAIKTLEVERKKVLAAIAAFEKKAKPVLRKIERDLTDEAPDVDNFEWPEPDDGDEDDDPLFDSTRDYVEQVDRYKEHQGKTIERKTTEKVCPECGETFMAKRSTAQFCCKEHAAAFRYKQKVKKRED